MYNGEILQNEVTLDIINGTYENNEEINMSFDNETLSSKSIDDWYNWGFGY